MIRWSYFPKSTTATVLAIDLPIRCFSGRGRAQLTKMDTVYPPTAFHPEAACNL